jgi:predicted SnoaL-like aldol condensation-catalyzing enzyme
MLCIYIIIVRNFYKDVFIAKNASAAVNYLEENYIQHNPNVPTGREAFINVLLKFSSRILVLVLKSKESISMVIML